MTGVSLADDHTVVVQFSQPVPTFTFMSIAASAEILPKHVYAGTDIRINPANNRPVGTGPWKIKEWVRGSYVEFDATRHTGCPASPISTSW